MGKPRILKDENYSNAVNNVIEKIDKGELRTASPVSNGWQVNEWVKQAILIILWCAAYANMEYASI